MKIRSVKLFHFRGHGKPERASTAENEVASRLALESWLEKHQPCLLVESRRSGTISYCFLKEEDLARGDRWVADKIDDARLAWTAESFRGKRAHLCAVAIERVANSAPDDALLALVRQLPSYTGEDIETNRVLLDEIFLKLPARRQRLGSGRRESASSVPRHGGTIIGSGVSHSRSARLATWLSRCWPGRCWYSATSGSRRIPRAGPHRHVAEALEFAMRTIPRITDALGRAASCFRFRETWVAFHAARSICRNFSR